jgi:N-acetyl-beta-hexosaminidase
VTLADTRRDANQAEIDGLEVVSYESARDGAVVVEINYPGHLRIIVGEHAVFDSRTEA